MKFIGLLLMRVRDELKMTIAAYQTLYQSSLTFGMRKQMQSEQGKTELEQKLNELSKNKAQLLERVTSIYFRKRNC
jgi:dynein light intermediate chain, axonemal